jgi:GR25 family glycosyltransferase involved in LPS biosynthesis
MSYVPPHKRRLGKAGQGATATATATATDTATATATATASTKNKNKSNSNDDNKNTAANKLLFCEAFSFIRCINLKNRPEQYDKFVYHVQCRIGSEFVNQLKRFDAVNGKEVVMASSSSIDFVDDVALEWDTTTNSLWDRHVKPGLIRQMTPGEIGCALSHISLWKELVTMVDDKEEEEQEQEQQVEQRSRSMLIFEDDAAFLNNGGQQRKDRRDNNANDNDNANANVDDRFIRAFEKAWKILPKDWDIFYLGFSDRGERKELIDSSLSSSSSPSSSSSLNDNGDDDDNEDDLVVQIFKPTYGFHTHAYAIRKSAAKKLLHNLPAVGPIDVWLADNQWFGLNVYCSIIANEGYKNTGSPLVYQDRSMIVTGKGKSSVGQSGR